MLIGVLAKHIGHRVSQPGPYSKSTKINLLLAISGDDINRWRWREMWTGKGTTGTCMITFIQRVINDIGPGTAQRRYCFTMDNLQSSVSFVVWLVAYITLNSHISSTTAPTTTFKWQQSFTPLDIGWHFVHPITLLMVLSNLCSIQFRGCCESIWLKLQMRQP